MEVVKKMKIIFENFEDLPPRIQHLLEEERERIPEVREKALNRMSLLDECLKEMEISTEVEYPPVYVKPYAYVTPLDITKSYFTPFVRHAYVFTKKIDKFFTTVVGLSAASLVLADKDELMGIFGHEFLHYALKASLHLLFSRREPDSSFEPTELFIPPDKGEVLKHLEFDKLLLEYPNVGFKDDYVRRCIKSIELGGERSKALVNKIMKEWFERNLPCLPFEIEQIETQASLPPRISIQSIRFPKDIIEKVS